MAPLNIQDAPKIVLQTSGGMLVLLIGVLAFLYNSPTRTSELIKFLLYGTGLSLGISSFVSIYFIAKMTESTFNEKNISGLVFYSQFFTLILALIQIIFVVSISISKL